MSPVTPTTALRLSVVAVASVLAWAPPAHAQAPSVPTAHALKAVRLAKAPVIDGAVKDDEWAGAARVDTFVQFEPRRGEPASRRTEALVAYDATHLYVAFRCLDDEPLTARRTQRDGSLFQDDAVAVLIDTVHDRRTAYYFTTNPLGTQEDGRLTDDGRLSDTAWDAAWRSAAARTDDGWSAEFARGWAAVTSPARRSRPDARGARPGAAPRIP